VESDKNGFAVVAVGASAGGLDAFTKLLHGLPNNIDMAFVFIQHLDPKHHSILSDLLAKATNIPVVEASHRMLVEPNHVYIMPPNVNMRILRGRLQLTQRKDTPGLHLPIDFFMRSLAEAQNRRSIGVVLSGTASDGTRGLSAIKAKGGITFAQDEKSAKFNGMPHSAIASGCVDFVLSPEKIGLELARISRQPLRRIDVAPAKTTPAKTATAREGNVKSLNHDESFERIFSLLWSTCSINFRGHKSGTIQRRTLRRMANHKIELFSEYAKYMEKHPEETECLCQDLLIGVTRFFRDPDTFAFLKSKVFPALLKDKTNDGKIRIWTPACSTGEETYSLAILLLEFLGDKASSIQIQIFGTDVSQTGIDKARAAIYPARITQEVSPERLRRFFTKVDAGYRVSTAVRGLCIFAKHNLAEAPPFSQMNLITCRNMLIYLEPEMQSKIISILHYALRPSGFLMLGKSESVSSYANLFEPLGKKHNIFAKKTTNTKLHYNFSGNLFPKEAAIRFAAKTQIIAKEMDPQLDADRIVLKRYAPPGVVINENMEILQFRGAIAPYLDPAQGKATLHLLKMVKKDFVTELRAVFHLAKKSRKLATSGPLEFKRNHQTKSVNISVEPLLSSNEDPQYLVLFESTTALGAPSEKTTGKSRAFNRTAKEETVRLTRTLASVEEHLRSVIEDKELSDAEYQSANEEVLSSNEELQSTNEELETSQEELQSANEELNTVNDELLTRNTDLNHLNNDLNNITKSTKYPIVVVTRDLTIRRMTTASAIALRIKPSDIGRSITDVSPDIKISNLTELIYSVMETLTPQEVEVQDKNDRWYSLQIRPYLTADGKIDGAVLELSDIDALKQLNARLQRSKDFIKHIIDTVRGPLAVLNEELKVIFINQSFLKTFKVSRKQTEGKLFYRLGNAQWNLPQLRAILKEVMAKDTLMVDYEVEHDFPGLGKKVMLLNARKIVDLHISRPTLLLAIEDITVRIEAERLRSTFSAIVESSTDAIISKDLKGNVLSWNAGAQHLFGFTAEEMIGQPIVRTIPPELKDEVHQMLDRIKGGEHVEHCETFRLTKAGERVNISLTISPIKDRKGVVVGASMIARNITERKQREETALSVRLIQIQDEERKQIARGLHDSIGQSLAFTQMSLSSLKRPDATEKETELLSGAMDSVDNCLAEIRTISHLLHPPLLDLVGFSATAIWYAESFSERSGIPVKLDIPQDLKRMPEAMELALFRILQESLVNVHRHAHSPSVDIKVVRSNSSITLEVRDYGQGISPDLLEQFKTNDAGRGVGLRSIRGRISDLGGRFEIESNNKGTLIRVTAPVSNVVKKSAEKLAAV